MNDYSAQLLRRHTPSMIAMAIVAGTLAGCGGGGYGGSGMMASAADPSTAPTAAAPPETAPAASTTSQPTPDSARAQDPAPDPAAPPVAAAATLRRVFDTVNPATSRAGIDVELSQAALPGDALGSTFQLENPDGTVVAQGSEVVGTAGNFFPASPTLHKILFPSVRPGDYVIRSVTQWLEPATGRRGQVEATLPVFVQELQIDYVGFRNNARVTLGGSLRSLSVRYSSEAAGTLYVYAKGTPRDLCDDKTASDLAAMAAALQRPVSASSTQAFETNLLAITFADADTACLQFVNGATGASEKPYSFNLRYLSRPTSGDAVLELGLQPSTAKAGIALVSMPLSSNLDGAYAFVERRQTHAYGDVRQQSTSNSARISLEQGSSGWKYRLASLLASDHPVYAALAEGQAPLLAYFKP